MRPAARSPQLMDPASTIQSLFSPREKHTRRASVVMTDWQRFEAAVLHVGQLRHLPVHGSDLADTVTILLRWLQWLRYGPCCGA